MTASDCRQLESDEVESCACEDQSILIVEDDPFLADVICEHLLVTKLYTVDIARNAWEARQMFKPGRYFVVILDLHLGLSTREGIDLAVYFRDQDDNVFIVAVSGFYPVYDERLLRNVDDFLPKPVNYDFFLSKLLMWRIAHSRRLALKQYVEGKVLSYRKCLAEIREEEESIRETLTDLLKHFGTEAEEGNGSPGSELHDK